MTNARPHLAAARGGVVARQRGPQAEVEELGAHLRARGQA
jgi:hypothetical protein